MIKKSLCKKCENLFNITVKNKPGGSGDIRKVHCLVYDKAFDSLVSGMFDDGYPNVISCNWFLEAKNND